MYLYICIKILLDNIKCSSHLLFFNNTLLLFNDRDHFFFQKIPSIYLFTSDSEICLFNNNNNKKIILLPLRYAIIGYYTLKPPFYLYIIPY